MHFFASSARGLGPILAEELRALGAAAPEVRPAGVAFAGPLELAYRACLWSRAASRVLLVLGEHEAGDGDALYAGVGALPWEEHLAPGGTLAVDFTSTRSALGHTLYGAQRTKDAVVDRLRARRGARPSVDTADPSLRIHVHVADDRATVSIDLSGESLHRRGYRRPGAEAPLKESLAAALLLFAGARESLAAGAPFLDPMCGSGTLAIEAALLAADIAPGLLRKGRFGFAAWPGHDAALWQRLVEEAEARRRRRVEARIEGSDVDPAMVALAREQARRAGVAELVRFAVRPVEELAPPEGPPGLLVTNPPYGERLGDEARLGTLYERLGDLCRRRLLGWTVAVLAPDGPLGGRIGLRPAKKLPVMNGALPCRLLVFPIAATPVAREGRPRWQEASPAADAFRNRLTKNWKHLKKWARREGVTCFRVYDADLVEYAVAVDLYEDAAHVQEYAPPATVDPERAAERLRDIVKVVPEVLGIDPADVFLKVRRKQRPGAQYARLAERGEEREVREGGHRFLVNLSDYLDTGLFLDQRILRRMVGEAAAGGAFLNLFAYTGSATVYAARAGARATTSVDLSQRYLDWAGRNLARNGVAGPAHELVRADCLEWLGRQRRRWDVILVAPPSFSNSKRMRGTFDVQRDHAALLAACAERLRPGGCIFFVNHLRGFQLDREALAALEIEELTRKTRPPDFARDPRVHNSWLLRRRSERRNTWA